MISKIKRVASHSVAKNSLALFVLQFVNMLAPFIVLPYLSRVLGVEGFGTLMIAMSAYSIGFLITDYGLHISATYTISKNRDNIDYVGRLIGAIFFIKSFLTLLFSTLILLYAYFYGFGRDSILIALGISLNVLTQVFFPMWFFQGLEKMKSVTIYTVVAKMSYVLLVFLFIQDDSDVGYVLFLLGVSNAIAAIFAIKFIYMIGYSIRLPSLELVKKTLKESFQFFISRVSLAIYTSANTFVVGAFAGAQQAAIFGASEKLYQATQSVTNSISQALFPHMANQNNEKLLFKVIIIIGIPLMIGCFIISFWADEVMALIFGSDFESAGSILQIFLMITIVNFISVNCSYPAFAGIGKVSVANFSYVIGAIGQLACLIVLYKNNLISSVTVVGSVMIVEILIMMFRILMYKKLRS